MRCIVLLVLTSLSLQAQPTSPKEYEAAYEQRIRKSRIGDVYIPRDYQDAFIELERLSTKADLEKFRNAPEKEVAKKLHFGLGKWIMTNWSFYEGSRFSHFLKEKGLTFPDDMAQVTIRLFHRHLNRLPLEDEVLIKEYVDDRTKAFQNELNQREVIDSFRRKKEE